MESSHVKRAETQPQIINHNCIAESLISESRGRCFGIVIAAMVLMIGPSVCGQERRPVVGFQHANSYSISEIENVNLSNGNLMLHIPLAALSGRGTGPGYTVALNYDSKLWNAQVDRQSNGSGNNPEDQFYTRDLVAPSDQGGWYLDSGMYRLNLVNRLTLETEAPCMEYSGAVAYRHNAFQFKLELQLPDGIEKEFFAFGYDYDLAGYSDLDPNGVRHAYSYMAPAEADGVRQQFTSRERDNETGLDFFEARYYSSTQGRFTSADPFTVTPARVLDPQQLNLYGYVRNNPLVHIDPTGMIIDTGRLNEDELKRWQKIVDLANAKDKDGNYLNAKLHEEYDQLNSDERTFFIENHDFGSKSQTIGNFEVTKFKGDKDFSEAVIQLDFKKTKNIESPVAADEVPGFKKFDKLFGVKDDAILRLAELFGHEGAHWIFALDDVAGAVKLQQQLNERDAAFNSLPKGKGRYPFPPDVIQKMNAADKALIPTERYAQQVEKIINGELRATSKRKN